MEQPNEQQTNEQQQNNTFCEQRKIDDRSVGETTKELIYEAIRSSI